jgi:hypothetical protein
MNTPFELFPEDDLLDCYPEEIFDNPKAIKNFVCPIKFGILRDPVVDKCGHTYCDECIKSWVEANQKETCPLTGLNMDKTQLAPNLIVRSLLEEMSIKCIHFKKGCEWKGDLSKLLSHIRSDCHEVRVKCAHGLCRKFIQRKKYQAHLDACEFKPTECKLCKKIFPNNEMEFHLEGCEFLMVHCDQDCGGSIARCKLEAHKKVECPNTTIPCHFSTLGCSAKIKKRDEQTHVKDSYFEHILLLKDKLEKTSFENQILKVENQALQATVKSLSTEIQDLKEEFKYQEEQVDEKLQDNIVRWLRIPKVCTKCNEAKNLGMTKKLFSKAIGEYVCFDCLNSQSMF